MTATTQSRPIWKWRWLRLLNGISRLKGRKLSVRRRRGENLELNFVLSLILVGISLYFAIQVLAEYTAELKHWKDPPKPPTLSESPM